MMKENNEHDQIKPLNLPGHRKNNIQGTRNVGKQNNPRPQKTGINLAV